MLSDILMQYGTLQIRNTYHKYLLLCYGLTKMCRGAVTEQMVTKSYKMSVDGANVGFLALLVPTAVPPADMPPPESALPPPPRH